MNPQGGGAGQVNASNTNNQNFTSHPSLESLQTTLLPLFPLTTESEQRFLEGLPMPNLNLPQQGLTGVPLHESLNLSLGSNVSSSSSIAITPQNPSTNLDLSLSLTIGLAHQGNEVQVQGVHGGTSSDTVLLPSKRNHASGGFLRGESSNMGEQAPPAKRHVTEFQVGANNNLNPSPPLPERQVAQPFSETPRTEPIQGHVHVNPHNGSAPAPQPQPQRYSRVNRIANNFRRGVQGQLHHCLSCSGSSHHSFHRSSMTGPPSINNGSARNTPRVIAPPYPQTLGDNMAPLHGHINFQRGNMFGHNAHQAIMYHPPSDQAGPLALASSQGIREMSLTVAASSSRNQNNYQNQAVVPSPQPRVSHETFLPQQFSTVDMRRRLPAEVQSILNQVRVGRRTLMFEDLMVFDYSLVLLEYETELQNQLDPSHPGLSAEEIMGHIRRESFTSSVGTENQEDEEKCAICLEVYEDGDEIGKLDLCIHIFHVQCIKQWLMQRNVCPICKRIGLTINDAENESGAVVNNENANA
ncbi:probable E3 ubiquitin-protein ligase HIP1 [Cajanus cajan]|uniref:probable E3 ubiquitin-protein ligase HIP1 n=1 Tax=Cajanus cajan TaxID=3821 RepID=UPI00098D903A|nr:probable E3 ubiquitin-protein ligase HIP1 [Cajanus cajan]XP_029125436.1 probable E3 ubiquitin-protein ligase HIP1 [Cajanus cajan]